jgi:N6-adenosine-specific RNA methylase IME4
MDGPVSQETPNTVHGRLLEAVHISGYTFERACAELEWLLDEDRWKYVGSGYSDINLFLATIDFSGFRVLADQRKKLAQRLQKIESSQRATARLLGVGVATVNRDLDHVPSGTVPSGDAVNQAESHGPSRATVPNGTENVAPSPVSDNVRKVARAATMEPQREQKKAERPSRPLPDGKFRLIYADPPWRYEHIETENRAIENQYPTMSLDEICALSVPAADDAVLFLWATSPKLSEAMKVIEAWGFDYRTCAVWDKEKIGMGYYFRQQHELLLVAARGALPVPEPSDRVSSVIRIKRGGIHSRKPVQVIEMLESMYPHMTKKDRIELFTREPRAGWSAWGNEPAVAS